MKTGELYRDKEGVAMMALYRDTGIQIDPESKISDAWVFRLILDPDGAQFCSIQRSVWTRLTKINVEELSVDEMLCAAEEQMTRRVFENRYR